MKLNYDCIRDVLLALEDTLTIEESNYDLGEGQQTHFSFSFIDVTRLAKLDGLKKYTMRDIFYSVNKLDEAGLITAETIPGDDSSSYLISDITYAGHEFLQSIKSDTVWSDVKVVSKKVGAISLPIISSIASSILSKLIQKSIGIG